MKNMMHYKGYYGSVNYSDEDRLFYGKVEFIRALISYEGTDVKSLRQAFEEAVDDYLETCKEKGIVVEKPFKGSFNVRVRADLHRRIALAAAQKGLTLNKYIADVLEKETAKAN
ncbi:MAG: type II toxin-antitoxin system HicB family antitoxin [Syntrophobacteraceae bacterium]